MYQKHPCPYYHNMPQNHDCSMYACPYAAHPHMFPSGFEQLFANTHMPSTAQTNSEAQDCLRDYGPKPFVVNIEQATKQNDNFRTALWTGKHLQLTLMSINAGEDIGLEIHPHLDQFIRVEEGQGVVKMGERKDRLNFQANVKDGFAIIIPAGTWHNMINTGRTPLKVYSIYAPPQHPFGTVHQTKAIAEAAEEGHKR